MKRKIAAILGGFVMLAGLVVGVGQAPAVAHSVADANALCGGGYTLVGTRVDDFNEIDVFRSGTSYCAVARKLSWDDGTYSYLYVGIKANADSTYNNVDQGNYAHYAGPVYRTAANCVDVLAKQTYQGVTYSHGGNCIS